jgi:stromal membrane-associated protein
MQDPSIMGSGPPTQGINQLLQLPENRVCADCTSKWPDYASTRIGVFVCQRCAGIHGMLDKGLALSGAPIVSDCRPVASNWAEADLAALKAVGNLNAECYWEQHVPFGEEKPDASDPLEFVHQWIERKYVAGEFLAREVSHACAAGVRFAFNT